MRLGQIWKYPVKSMLGATVDAAALGEEGVVGDRMWALRDEERGAIASGRKLAAITRLAAAFGADGESVTITLPDGTCVPSTDADANDRLSAALEHRVSLWSKQPASNEEFYRRGRRDNEDVMTELRFVFGRLQDEPLPDFSVFPSEMLEFEYPPGNYFDCYPLMIMSTSALAAIKRALPDSAIDARRFRPSLVVDTGDLDGHPEFEWNGRQMRIGDTTVQIGASCPRCSMVTREFSPDLPTDRRVLRHIVRDLDQNVGVYATVLTGGPISVGDSVELL